MSEQSKPIEFIPLNKLSASKLNVRKANRKEDIEALAASIAAHVGASREDAQRQDIADRLACAINLDMRQYWSPGMALWSRLSKSALIDTLLSAPCNADLSERQRTEFQKAHVKLTKDEVAKLVANTLDGFGWLPDILITPKAQGAFTITEAGFATIAAE